MLIWLYLSVLTNCFLNLILGVCWNSYQSKFLQRNKKNIQKILFHITVSVLVSNDNIIFLISIFTFTRNEIWYFLSFESDIFVPSG